MSSFKNLRIVDNFYQTSAYFPMPTILVGTLSVDGTTSLGSYSLVQPYYVAGKDYYAMLLCCRNSSNTAQHLLTRGKCSLNFIPDDKKMFKEAVRLGWPGDAPEEKMRGCKFTLEDGLMAKEQGVEGGEEADFKLLLVQMGCHAFMFVFELSVALPYGAAVFAGGVPDLGAEKCSTVAADDAGRKHVVPAVSAAQSLTPSEFLLNDIPFIRRYDWLMGVFHPALGHLAFAHLHGFCKKINGESFLQ